MSQGTSKEGNIIISEQSDQLVMLLSECGVVDENNDSREQRIVGYFPPANSNACLRSIVPPMPSPEVINMALRTYENTHYPPNAFLASDYARMHEIALPVIVIDAITGGSAFLIFASNAIFSHGIPLVLELTWVGTALITQSVCLGLVENAHPRLAQVYRGGSTAGIVGIDGKMLIEDASATVLVSWDMAVGLTAIMVIFLLGHLMWHLVVAIRHIKLRPRVFFEPTPGSYRWVLEPAVPTTDFPIVKASDYAFSTKNEKSSDLA